MIRIRKSADRGGADHGWLKTAHTFSFAGYYDPDQMGFRSLRVINDDIVEGGGGFPTHPHREMEILSYVVEGALEHRDSMGNGSVIRRGDVQRMSAGTGITHSEFNPSPDERMRLLQIWIEPARPGGTPSYEQQHFTEAERRGRLRLIASSDGRDDSTTVGQDVSVYAGLLDAGDRVTLDLAPGRHAWVQLVEGTVSVGDEKLTKGDGAAVSDEASLQFTSSEGAELLVFDLA